MRMKQRENPTSLTDEERQALIGFVEKLLQRFNGRLLSAILFGSRARGEAGPDSDMDVLVVVDSDDLQVRKEIRHLAVDVWLEHGIYLSTRVWSRAHLRELEGLQTMLFRNIERDGIDLLRLAAGSK